MNVDVGRKVQVAVFFTPRLLERLDEVARREAKDGDEPNRSRVIRRMVAEGLEREERVGEEALREG